jgi:hypothetical protein
MPSVESLMFDLTDCILREQTTTHRGWMNSAYPGPRPGLLISPIQTPLSNSTGNSALITAV